MRSFMPAKCESMVIAVSVSLKQFSARLSTFVSHSQHGENDDDY